MLINLLNYTDGAHTHINSLDIQPIFRTAASSPACCTKTPIRHYLSFYCAVCACTCQVNVSSWQFGVAYCALLCAVCISGCLFYILFIGCVLSCQFYNKIELNWIFCVPMQVFWSDLDHVLLLWLRFPKVDLRVGVDKPWWRRSLHPEQLSLELDSAKFKTTLDNSSSVTQLELRCRSGRGLCALWWFMRNTWFVSFREES